MGGLDHDITLHNLDVLCPERVVCASLPHRHGVVHIRNVLVVGVDVCVKLEVRPGLQRVIHDRKGTDERLEITSVDA